MTVFNILTHINNILTHFKKIFQSFNIKYKIFQHKKAYEEDTCFK